LADDNISPSVNKQLVLELEHRVRFTERIHRLPRSRGRRKACPLNEDVPLAALKLGMQHLLRLLERTSMLQGRESQSRRRRRSMEWLENAHMEHVVDARAILKSKTISDAANTFLHLVQPGVARAELAAAP
jgi:hypothetical protein